MQEVPARAALVSAPDVGEGLSTSVSRDEIEKALRTDNGPLDLILDVTRFSDGEPAETRSVTVAWERTDLEQLLKEAAGDRVTLTFDGQTLRDALEADFEAHGMREKVLVLAVAVTAAGGITATAAGTPLAPGPSTEPVQTIVSPDDRAVPRGGPAPQVGVSPDDRAVPRSAPAPQVGVSPDDRAIPRTGPAPQVGVSPDDRAVPHTAPAPQVGVSPDDRAVPRTGPAPQVGISPDDRAVPRTSPVSQPQPTGVSPDDRALPRTSPAPASQPVSTPADSDSWFSAPSPETVAVVGGMALAITGAAFAAGAAARRRVTPT